MGNSHNSDEPADERSGVMVSLTSGTLQYTLTTNSPGLFTTCTRDGDEDGDGDGDGDGGGDGD